MLNFCVFMICLLILETMSCKSNNMRSGDIHSSYKQLLRFLLEGPSMKDLNQNIIEQATQIPNKHIFLRKKNYSDATKFIFH